MPAKPARENQVPLEAPPPDPPGDVIQLSRADLNATINAAVAAALDNAMNPLREQLAALDGRQHAQADLQVLGTARSSPTVLPRRCAHRFFFAKSQRFVQCTRRSFSQFSATAYAVCVPPIVLFGIHNPPNNLRRRVSLRRLLRTEYVSATARRAVSALHALVYSRSLLQSVSPSKAFRGGSVWLGRLARPCLGRVTDVTDTDLEPSRWFWSRGSYLDCIYLYGQQTLLCNSSLGISAFDPYTASYRNNMYGARTTGEQVVKDLAQSAVGKSFFITGANTGLGAVSERGSVRFEISVNLLFPRSEVLRLFPIACSRVRNCSMLAIGWCQSVHYMQIKVES